MMRSCNNGKRVEGNSQSAGEKLKSASQYVKINNVHASLYDMKNQNRGHR
jgi:hypothetical protein